MEKTLGIYFSAWKWLVLMKILFFEISYFRRFDVASLVYFINYSTKKVTKACGVCVCGVCVYWCVWCMYVGVWCVCVCVCACVCACVRAGVCMRPVSSKRFLIFMGWFHFLWIGKCWKLSMFIRNVTIIFDYCWDFGILSFHFNFKLGVFEI